MKIEGSIVLVTGGASGIGEFIAFYYMERGAVVYICDLQEEKGKEIEKKSNSKIKFIKCDITNEDSVKNMIDSIKSEQGHLDILINSAGIVWGELLATDKAMHGSAIFDKVLKVNTFGSFLVSKYAAKLMIDTSDSKRDCNGVIILIASIAGIEGQKGQTAYSASKGALIGMTLPMARDLGRYKIRVNSVAPGIIESPMTAGMQGNKVGKTIIDSTPLKILGKPLHVCQTTEFIAVCDFVNGATIRVDGGVRLPHF
jgi:NAD(P)-dependent dehydrogenase (short-subunit alcohol dehydrogenase family)